jgi:glutathione S-transferase
MKVYGHPWSINTRKVLLTLAEKGHEAELVLVMLPKGEHRLAPHLARHPFGKVPTLEDAGFVLYETAPINRYLERTLPGPALVPADPKGAARVDQWIGVADAYFIVHAQQLVVEQLFRRYLGGERNQAAIDAARAGIGTALDAADRVLCSSAFFAGASLSLADIHWLPYFEYLTRIGDAGLLDGRPHLRAWWERVSARSSWQKVARTGPQPYDAGVTAEVIERQYR